jgi:aminoglycoside phosphotransferase (APT) family kinase protein
MARWIAERSVECVRAAVREQWPELAELPVTLHDGWVETDNPLWARSSAFVGDSWVVKYAWTEEAAERLATEIATHRALATSPCSVPIRRVHAASAEPVLLLAPFVSGDPVTVEAIAAYTPAEKQRLARALAEVLAAFHDPATARAVVASGVPLRTPQPQATTDELRERLEPMLDARRRALVARWCDWTDDVLAPAIEPVVLHGDFHGYNVVIDDQQRVRVVLDVEEASWGDHHYDFRYLPGQEATLELFLATAAEYEVLTNRHVDVRRVLAWNVRTVLGDALWRTEARVGLPGGGTKEQWIDTLAEHFEALA